MFWATRPVGPNSLAKLVPDDPKMTLVKALDKNPELAARAKNDPDVARVMEVAIKLEGNKRHASQHACGLVISPGKITDYLPTSLEKDKETGERSLTAQVTMTEVEDLSLIKMDLLGLKNLTAIHEVIDTVKRTRSIDTTYEDLPLDDRETYKMLSKGITGGVFQLEGGGMTNNVIIPMFDDIDSLPESRLHECFERLIAAVALYRPGPWTISRTTWRGCGIRLLSTILCQNWKPFCDPPMESLYIRNRLCRLCRSWLVTRSEEPMWSARAWQRKSVIFWMLKSSCLSMVTKKPMNPAKTKTMRLAVLPTVSLKRLLRRSGRKWINSPVMLSTDPMQLAMPGWPASRPTCSATGQLSSIVR